MLSEPVGTINKGFPYTFEPTRDPRPDTDSSYAAKVASQWRTLQRLAENLVFSEAPKLIRQLQQSTTLQRGIKIGLEVLAGTAEAPVEITTGRPVTRTSSPTAHRARKLVYSPDLDGRADPGEVVWTWVTYEEDPTRGKDRPVLVVGRDHATLLGLMMSSQERHAADRDWVEIGSGSWDYDGRPSWVRLDRVLDVPEESIRREGAILDRTVFDVVAARLRRDYSWT
jgi:PemK-like, MazF-like toxin of type II toxin-antitoxin system